MRAEFQRYIKNCLNDVRDKFGFPYLDDELVYSDDFGLYVEHLRQVFQILRENGIEAVVQRCSVKKVFLEISQNSQENTCARVLFLIKPQNTSGGCF